MGRKGTFLNSHMTGLCLGLSVPRKEKEKAAAVIVSPAAAVPTCQQSNNAPV